jgi:hypothetical protein
VSSPGSIGGTDPEHAAKTNDLSEVINFSSYDLRTTLRLIILSGESRRIEVKRGSRRASVFITGGEVFRVETDDKSGDEALFEILSWDKTSHSDSQHGNPGEKNIRIPTDVLLDLIEKNR